jgi:hypothetical protein
MKKLSKEELIIERDKLISKIAKLGNLDSPEKLHSYRVWSKKLDKVYFALNTCEKTV